MGVGCCMSGDSNAVGAVEIGEKQRAGNRTGGGSKIGGMKRFLGTVAAGALAAGCLFAIGGCAKSPKAVAPVPPPAVSTANANGAVQLEIKALNDQRKSSVAPVYPSNKRGQSADVTMNVTIDETGRVISAVPTGAVDSDFAASAVASVMQWRYKPYMTNGQAVPMQGPVTIHFRNQ